MSMLQVECDCSCVDICPQGKLGMETKCLIWKSLNEGDVRHKTLWIQEDAASGKLKASLEKPSRVTGRLIAVTIVGDFIDVTDGGFYTVEIERVKQ